MVIGIDDQLQVGLLARREPDLVVGQPGLASPGMPAADRCAIVWRRQGMAQIRSRRNQAASSCRHPRRGARRWPCWCGRFWGLLARSPLLGTGLGQVDVKAAGRVVGQALPCRLVALDLRQAADPVPLQAAMQG